MQAVISLSGGMDSSTLLLNLLREGYDVTAISIDYGQKHRVELERAQELVSYIKETNKNVVLSHDIIKLDGLGALLDSNLVLGGNDVPEGHYEEENMKQTVVPNRNKIFSSIIQAVALSVANRTKQSVKIAMGIHAGDHAIYPDCRQEFRDADYEAFQIGNWEAEGVTYYTPYLDTDKYGILQDGQVSCSQLGLNFSEVYKRTNTSYKPIYITTHDHEEVIKSGYKSCGENSNLYYKWYSDYKSASSVERIEAFIKLRIDDPVAYADENGPVPYSVAKSHVEKLLAEY